MGRYPWAEIFLLEVLRILVFYPTHHHLYRITIFTAMIYITARIYLTQEVTGSLSLIYTVGGTIPLHLAHAAHILWGEGPFPDYWRRVRDEVRTEGDDKGGSNNLPSNFPFSKRLWWMLDIAYSFRMIGWVQEPTGSLPQPPPPSRRRFLWMTLLKLVINLAIADLSTIFFAGNPACDSRVHNPTDGPETYLFAVSLLRRAPYILAFAFMGVAIFGSVHNVAALVCVGLGGSSPTLWPDIGGSWKDSYTLRKFWGRTWHQRMRPTIAGAGRLVANKILKFPRGTKGSSYIQLYLAFLMTAVFHFAGDFMFERRLVSRSFKFFLLQAVAITFEDFVIYLGKRLLLRGGIEFKSGDVGLSWMEVFARGVGFCWVLLWFCFSFPIWVSESSVAGLNNVDRGPLARFVMDRWESLA